MAAQTRRRRRLKQRKPDHPLPKQRPPQRPSVPRLAGRQRILDYLGDTIGMCEALFEEHGVNCDCESCCVTANLVGSLRVFRLLLEIS